VYRIARRRGRQAPPHGNGKPPGYAPPSTVRMPAGTTVLHLPWQISRAVRRRARRSWSPAALATSVRTSADLLLQYFDVVVFDSFVNSSPKALDRAMELGGRTLTVYEGDVRDLAALRHVFESELTISSVVHLAGLKAVGESVAKPIMYYDFNVAGSINLLQIMSEYNCKKLVFSSSATVYGETDANPIKETEPLSATSPYGRSKLMVEDMLRDQCKADEEWGVAILRYFNPVGAPLGHAGRGP